MLFLAIVTLLLTVISGVEVLIGSRKIGWLRGVAPLEADGPRVSIVIPACNEEPSIEPALRSVLALDYSDYEVIAVDDRSTDSTGAILDRIALGSPHLKVVHVRQLPAGWLGKNHALQEGARQATGFVLLFTDADVIMEPSVLRRAVAYLEREHLDMLAIAPKATVRGFLANAFVSAFSILFCLYTKPWKVSDPKSRYHIGIGAFNMVRTEAYWKSGGHEPIAMRPDDDVKLGKLIKAKGFTQGFLFGTELIDVEWYSSFSAMLRGLEKNMFAGAGYRLSVVLLSLVLQFVLFVWPFAGIFATTGPARLVNALTAATLIVTFALNAPRLGIARWWGFVLPLASLVAIYVIARSTFITLVRGGIDWRGTRYSLRALKANRF